MKQDNTRRQAEPIPADETDYYRVQRKFWSIFASFYDFLVAPASGLRKRVAGLLSLPKGAKVLDVATGTGKQAFAFALNGYEVTGVDLSEAMLRIAKRKNKYQNLKFQSADAAQLPFANAGFDAASVSFALHEMPLVVREKTLREMARVTRPGGKIAVVDFGLPDNKIGRFLIYNLVRAFEGAHYVKFMKTDLKTSITKAGIAIDSEIRILWGGGRIITGTVSD